MDQRLEWEQRGGVQQRGAPETLILYRLHPKRTSTRTPGPGPIRDKDWARFAEQHLNNRNVVLHTDGARAYLLKLPGMLHDHVVHQKKKLTDKDGKSVKRDGKHVWIQPKYTRTLTHVIPGTKKKLHCVGGTQVIDRFWQHLKSYTKCRAGRVGSMMLRDRIRSAQWAHWYRMRDLWAKTGEMLSAL